MDVLEVSITVCITEKQTLWPTQGLRKERVKLRPKTRVTL